MGTMQVLGKCKRPCEWASKIKSCEIQCVDMHEHPWVDPLVMSP
jgi:hypothetical protein